MSALKYFILDYRIIRGKLKYYLLIPIMVIFLIVKESNVFALGYLFFILLYIAPNPFTLESKERGESFYYSLPSKVSNMVLGRYLYLISAMIMVWSIAIVTITYRYNTNTIQMIELWLVSLSGVVATTICFIQYPLYYKLGVEKAKALVLGVPSMLVFILPTLLNKKFSSGTTLKMANKYLNNEITVLVISLIFVSIVGFISYHFSLLICKRKEI